ncbi:hypothetical protein AB833_07995 [Chromatiales bacterium (ex Bugula neritina AB1)]|nr:hypothetical protein AB833_07995 [Chromatiales bacterium (ex Bugula neritina AB1)]
MNTRFIAVLILCVISSYEVAVAADSNHHSPYASEQNRTIKSLSQNDIADLTAGAGWGLAKAAELNGVPGPMHLLEMKDEIGLTDVQIESIDRVFNEMRSDAKLLGKKLILQETALDDKFKNDVPTPEELRIQLAEIGETRSSLRYVHLSAHLKMPKILSASQIDSYNQLRGYTVSDDPCANVPAGHNEEMWKKHNNCG